MPRLFTVTKLFCVPRCEWRSTYLYGNYINMATIQANPPLLIDRFGRRVDYLRISVTDRCDFRCIYCMSDNMSFLPRTSILSLDEIEFTARTFVNLGVDKIRVTGGEPLVRKGVIGLLRNLGRLEGLRELAITCLLYTSPSPRDRQKSRMPSSA